MAKSDVTKPAKEADLRSFMRALLDDVRALERMLETEVIEGDVRRIGAEQEMFLVDRNLGPAPVVTEVLEKLGDPRFTTELARFNLEANLSPQVLGGECLSEMEKELEQLVGLARAAARSVGADVLLTGILPTLKQDDLTLENMTPNPRYRQLNDVMSEACGGHFLTLIKGLDELQTTHDNVMMEACNTSFQVHFQVGPTEFVPLYNLAQAVTAPVLAAGVNSATLLQHRLWKETRVALFQQSLDTRSEVHKKRGRRGRVSFGDRWLEESVLEIFREDIARFRVLISTELDGPSSTELLARGVLPPLRALCLHNGTVYRWNRPCYGVHGDRAHLRIENRVLPAGPTIADELANAAFYLGLMCALSEEFSDITKVMSFDDAKANFLAAARYGLKARFSWIGGRQTAAEDLILGELLPMAHAGLLQRGIRSTDVDRYLGLLGERVRTGRTGARWALDSLAAMEGHGSREERFRTLTRTMAERAKEGAPVHTWPLAEMDERRDWRASYQTVGQVMTTDVFTVHPEDLVDLAASLMEWEHIRHVPVEDEGGKLVGLVSHRALLRLVGRGLRRESQEPVAVRQIMKADPVTVSPETSTIEALEIMRRYKVSCLPVTRNGSLVGIVTERDFIVVAAKLLEEELRKP